MLGDCSALANHSKTCLRTGSDVVEESEGGDEDDGSSEAEYIVSICGFSICLRDSMPASFFFNSSRSTPRCLQNASEFSVASYWSDEQG